ncbi:hypothetical protein SDC9_110097 [bioreactor metagenome]|uniref:Uncharacterized protein n=1 Tax=bioreactor metagenome TaxID=1076179 RepID=A0A645BD20_9ZZZZ
MAFGGQFGGGVILHVLHQQGSINNAGAWLDPFCNGIDHGVDLIGRHSQHDDIGILHQSFPIRFDLLEDFFFGHFFILRRLRVKPHHGQSLVVLF